MALQDPYCAWDKQQGKCRSHGAPRWNEENYFYQSVATGQHAACPPSKLTSKDAGSLGGLSSNLPKSYNQDSMLPSKDQPEGQVINIMQDKEYGNSGTSNNNNNFRLFVCSLFPFTIFFMHVFVIIIIIFYLAFDTFCVDVYHNLT